VLKKKSTKIMEKLFLIIFSMLASLFFLFIIFQISGPYEILAYEGKARVNLRNLGEHPIAVIHGEWLYFKDVILSPEETKVLHADYARNGLDEFFVDEKLLKSTFKLNIKTDREYDNLILGLHEYPLEKINIWVNGEKIHSSTEKGVNTLGIRTFSSESPNIEIVINLVRDNVSELPVLNRKVYLANYESYLKWNYFKDIKDFIIVGGIIFIGIYNFILFFSLKQKKLFLFSFISIFGAIRIFLGSLESRYFLIISMDIKLYTILLSWVTSLSLIFFQFYLMDICNSQNMKKILKSFIILLFSSMCLMIPPQFFWWNQNINMIVSLLSLCASGYFIIHSYFRNYKRGKILAIGGTFSIVLIIADILIKNSPAQIYPDIDPSGIGIAFFMFCLTLVTSEDISESYKKAEKLSKENIQMSTELNLIDRRLERRISAQTSFLTKIIDDLQTDKNSLQNELGELEKQLEDHKSARKEITKAYDKVAKLSFMDPLTGIYNRRGFLRWLTENHYGSRGFSPYCVAIADIDDFKQINDMYGHNFGDGVLVCFSGILKSYTDKTSCVARWGGEEFIIAFPIMNEENTENTFENIRERVSKEIFLNHGKKFCITMTFGVAIIKDKMEIADAIETADKLLYAGKRKGKNQVII